MPYAIHEEAARRQMNLNVSQPQEPVPEVLPENWSSTGNRGLPVRLIPHFEFPIVVYLWPNEPTKTIIHRNDRHEVIHEEEIPLEHLTRTLSCEAHKNGGPKECAACNEVLEAALAEGWRRESYIPAPPANPNEGLYGPRKTIQKQQETK
jgi:hypothetical protein